MRQEIFRRLGRDGCNFYRAHVHPDPASLFELRWWVLSVPLLCIATSSLCSPHWPEKSGCASLNTRHRFLELSVPQIRMLCLPSSEIAMASVPIVDSRTPSSSNYRSVWYPNTGIILLPKASFNTSSSRAVDKLLPLLLCWRIELYGTAIAVLGGIPIV